MIPIILTISVIALSFVIAHWREREETWRLSWQSDLLDIEHDKWRKWGYDCTYFDNRLAEMYEGYQASDYEQEWIVQMDHLL